MIANSPRKAVGWSAATIVLAASLICAGLTNAQTPKATTTGNKDAPAAKSGENGAGEVIVKYDDGTADGQKSLGASGHAVAFKRPANATWVEAVEIFASRYGHPEPPKESFHVYVLNNDRQVLADVPIPYETIKREAVTWYTLRTPSIEVPEEFLIGLAFNPAERKGIYLSYDKNVEKSHSLVGLPDEGYEPVTEKYDWMVRVQMAAKPSGQKGTFKLADWKPPKKTDTLAGTIILPRKVVVTQDKQSYGGEGPAIEFTIEPSQVGETSPAGLEKVKVRGFSLYASRYGSGYDAQTTMVKVAVLDSKGAVRWKGEVPYALFKYKPAWVNVTLPKPMPLLELAQKDGKLTVAFDPEAQQRKGIYFHYQKEPAKSHSSVGTVASGFEPVSTREWLIRIHLQKERPAGSATRPTDKR